MLLAEGITVGGKRLSEHLEIIGHSEAIKYLEDIIKNNVELSEREIKNLHSLVTKDIKDVFIKTSNLNIILINLMFFIKLRCVISLKADVCRFIL